MLFQLLIIDFTIFQTIFIDIASDFFCKLFTHAWKVAHGRAAGALYVTERWCKKSVSGMLGVYCFSSGDSSA